MKKLNAWIPESELEAVQEVKGDISTSLFVRRAIKKAVNEAKITLLEGSQVTNSDPNQPASNATTTPTTPQGTNSHEEVEVV